MTTTQPVPPTQPTQAPETSTPADGAGRPAYAIAVVCLGNICRSPIAAVVLSAKLVAAGLLTVALDSAGTGGWHVGEPMDHRAADVLSRHGYDPSHHRARQFAPQWFDEHDLVLAMDRATLEDLQQLARGDDDLDTIAMFRSFDPEATSSLDVPDPWYGGRADFELVIDIVERTTDAIVGELGGLLGPGRA